MAHMQIWGAVFERIHHSSRSCQKWGVTSRQVQILCKENRVPGASRMSRIWIIPENAEKPTGIRHPKERRTD